MNWKKTGLSFGLALALCPTVGAASDKFHWSGRVQPGQSIEIKGINGNIEATPTGGVDIQVSAIKKGRRQDPSSVQIQVVPHSGGVTICAVYPDVEGRNQCAPGSEGRMNVRDNDVKVDFTVAVPAGVHFVGRTVNGGISAERLLDDVKAYTVNGNVDVICEGLALAKTVNGSISVVMGRADWDGDLEFETVNGSITVELPSNVNAEVSAKTVNGGIDSDFSLPVSGKWGPKKMEGRLGSGGSRLDLKTVNGGIKLRSVR